MSQERIVTQPLGDPVGSIFEVDGKCYVKTADAGATMNKMVTNEDGECAKEARDDMIPCETGSGAREAVPSASGGYPCFGSAGNLDSLDYTRYYGLCLLWGRTDDYARRFGDRQGWELLQDQGAQWDDIPNHNGEYGCGSWTNPEEGKHRNIDPKYQPETWLGRYYSMKFCRFRVRGWVQFNLQTPISGFDEFMFFSDGVQAFYRPGSITLQAQHAETDEWHYFSAWNPGKWMQYHQDRYNVYRNPRAHTMGHTLPFFLHEGANQPDEKYQIHPKFHNMPIKAFRFNLATGTNYSQNWHMHIFMLWKNGARVKWADNSIVLRTPQPEFNAYLGG